MTNICPSLSLRQKIGRVFGHAGFLIILIAATMWTATALSLQLENIAGIVAITILAVMSVASLVLRFGKRRYSWATLAVLMTTAGLWYQTIEPAQNRDWAPELAHGVSGKIDGDTVTLSNIRNFDWSDPQNTAAAWEERAFNLTQLESVDMFTSVWDNPSIAHLIVSFGFSDGEHVAFSAEIRREVGEEFSEIGGFFRQFELILIAADENDVIRLRTDYRNEKVRMFPINLNAAQRKDLFLSYVALGNDLAETPAFYNTVTANCTTTIYRLAKVVKPDMPLDWRLLMSGHLPEYLDELGGFSGEMQIKDRVAAALINRPTTRGNLSGHFSDQIRRTHKMAGN